MTFPYCHRCSPLTDCRLYGDSNNPHQRKQRHSLKLGKKRRESSKRNYYIISPRVIIKAIIIIPRGFPDKEGVRVFFITLRGVALMVDSRPFPDVGLRGTPDSGTCEDWHHDWQHQFRLVTGPLGRPTGPSWDDSPVAGLIVLEDRALWGSRLCRHKQHT